MRFSARPRFSSEDMRATFTTGLINYSDPFGLCPFGAAICKAWQGFLDWQDARAKEFEAHCERNSAGRCNPVELGMPSWIGGPGEARGLIAGAKYTISEGLEGVTSAFSDKALLNTYRGAIDQINRYKEILTKASAEQVRSITADIVKHEKRLQAAIEELARRGINPP
jgi:hypothetical protein